MGEVDRAERYGLYSGDWSWYDSIMQGQGLYSPENRARYIDEGRYGWSAPRGVDPDAWQRKVLGNYYGGEDVSGWDLPRVGETGAGATGFTEEQTGILSPTSTVTPITGGVAGQESYWSNPQNIIKWHNDILADPDIQLPKGVTKDEIGNLYNYIQIQNQGVDNSKYWQAFGAGDPMLDYVRNMPNPGNEFLIGNELGTYGVPSSTVQMDFTAPDFNWMALTIDEKNKILNDPTFSIADVVSPGQQGLILDDPAFSWEGLPGWQKTAFYALSNPRTAPYVNVLPIAVTGITTKNPVLLVLAGGMVAATMGTQSENETVRSVSETLLRAFNWGAEKVEQSIGFADQMVREWGKVLEAPPEDRADIAAEFVLSLGGPEGMIKGIVAAETGKQPEELDEETLKGYANWEAQRMYYESQAARHGSGVGDFMLNLIFSNPEATDILRRKDEIIKDEGYAEYFKQQWDTLTGKREAGEVWVLGEGDPVPVMPGYTLDDARKYILDGASPDQVLQEFQRVYGINGVATDFLYQSILDPLEFAPDVTGKIGEKYHLGKAGKALKEGDVARANIEAARAKGYEAGGMWESARGFRDEARTLSTAEVTKMTKWEQFLAGVTPEGQLKELQPTKPGLFNYIRTLTPESKVAVASKLVFENVGLLFDRMGNDLIGSGELLHAVADNDMTTIRDMGASFLDNPEVYTVEGAIRDFVPVYDNELSNYQSVDPNRKLLFAVSDMLGEKPKDVVKNLATDPRLDFNRLVEMAKRENNTAFLDMVAAGLDADGFGKMLEVFKDDHVPVSPEEFKYKMFGELEKHMRKWGDEFYKVKNMSEPAAAIHLLKNWQSMMLLDYSPRYLLNNVMNEEVLMAAGGHYNLTSIADIDHFIAYEFGVRPGTYGVGQNLADFRTGGVRYGDGFFNKLAKGSSQLRRKIGLFNNLTGKLNQIHGKRILYSSLQKYYGRNWRPGVGFKKMPATLETGLRERGIDPNMFYENVQGMMRPEHFDSLLDGITDRTVDNYVNEAANALGARPEEITDMLGQLGVLDELRKGLDKAETPEQIQAVFDRIEKKAMEANDIRLAENIRNTAEIYADKVRAEGYAGAHNLLLDQQIMLERTWTDMYTEWGSLFEKMEDVTDPVLRRNMYRNQRLKNQANWRRYYALEAATYMGILDGFGARNELKQEFIGLLSEYELTNRRTADAQMSLYEAFFDSLEANKEVDWGATEAEANRLWNEAEAKKVELWKQINDLTVDVYKETFGPGVEVTARKWVDERAAFHAQMVEAKNKLHADMQGMTRQERAARKWVFYQQEYPNMIREFTTRNIVNEGELYKGVDPDTLEQYTMEQGQAQLERQQAEQARIDSVREEVAQAVRNANPELDAYMKEAEAQGIDVTPTAGPNDLRAIAAEYGIPSVTEGGVPFDNRIVATIRKYGHGDTKWITGMDDPRLTPEIARAAFEERQAVIDAQATLDNALVANAEERGTVPPEIVKETPPDPLELRRTEVLDLITHKPLEKLPETVQEPLRRILGEMLDEARAGRKSSIIEAIRDKGGLRWQYLKDITGETSTKKAGLAPGVFKKGGDAVSLDVMARWLAEEEGFPIDINDPNDNGGINQLTALIQREMAGEKVYSMKEDAAIVKPDWYKGLKGLKNKQAVVDAHISRMLAGQDNAAFNVDINATERAIKAEAFRRLGDEAKFDGRLSDATGHPYDIEGWSDRVLEMANEAGATNDLMRVVALLDEVDSMLDQLPDSMKEVYSGVVNGLRDDMVLRLDELDTQQKIRTATAQAEAALKAQETRGDMLINRETLREQLLDAGIDETQLDTYFEIFDAAVGRMADKYGMSPDELMGKYYGGIVRGGEGDLQQVAYHGSPYKFDKFTLDHMGEGEGAQAYGWGLYFTDKKKVGEFYRFSLAEHVYRVGDRVLKGNEEWAAQFLHDFVYDDRGRFSGTRRVSLKEAEKRITETIGRGNTDLVKEVKEYARELSKQKLELDQGQLYKVEIPDENYLLWDRPLNEQPQAIKDYLRDEYGIYPEDIEQAQSEHKDLLDQYNKMVDDRSIDEVVKSDLHKRLAEVRNYLYEVADNMKTGADIYTFLINGETRKAGYELRQKYGGLLDAQARQDQLVIDFKNRTGKEALVDGVATKDFVGKEANEWNDIANLVERTQYRRGAGGTRKAASIALNEIGVPGIKYLAGDSRARGEGNYNYVIFDENAINILETYYQGGEIGQAAKGAVSFADNGKALIHAYDGADITTVIHENAHVWRRMMSDIAEFDAATRADMDILESWAEVKDGVWTRDAEEKFARGFEKYLAEGKAPIAKLQAVFDKIKTWMLEVYRVIKGSDIDVRLTDEVRQVFDRMLAEEPNYDIADRTGQGVMFGKGEDTPLFSGVAQTVKNEVFAPKPPGPKQGDLFQLGEGTERLQFNVNEEARRAEVDSIVNTERFRKLKEDAKRIRALRKDTTAPKPWWELLDERTEGQPTLNEQVAQAPAPGETPTYQVNQQARERMVNEITQSDFFKKLKEARQAFKEGRADKLFQTAPPVDSPEFKQWFGDSKMVDENGKPLIAYHGTNMEFDTFSPNAIGSANDMGYYGKGFYFTFGGEWSKGEAGYYGRNIMEVYLKVEKPYDFSTLYQYKGEPIYYVGPESIVFLSNIAEQFPELADRIFVDKGIWDAGLQAYKIERMPIKELPKLIEKYRSSLKVETINDSMHNKQYKSGYVKETDGYPEWLGNYDNTLSDPELEILLIRDALDKYDNISADYYPEGYMTRHPEISEAIKTRGYDGIIQSWQGDEVLVFKPEQIKSIYNQGTFSQENPSILFQDGGDVPLMPPNGYDQISKNMDMTQMLYEGWVDNVRPMMDAMREAANKPETRYSVRGFDDNLQKQLRNYIQDLKNSNANVKHAALRHAETDRNFALLDYQRQYGADKIANLWLPYQLFTTHSGWNWATRVMDRPAWMSRLLRLKNLHNTYLNQQPERNRDKFRVSMPWLPSWMGDSVWIDPVTQLYPLEQYMQPLDFYERDQNYLENNAAYILRQWSENGQISEEKASAAMQSKQGPEWERALEQAKLEQKAEGNNKNAASYAQMLVSPPLFATIPIYLATGKPYADMGWPNSQLPITQFGEGLETVFKGTSLEPLGNAAGTVFAGPERWAREQLDLNEFGEWGDYYVDRQLANMAVDSGYSVQEVEKAMIERKGSIYDEAVARVHQELALRVPGLGGLNAMMKGASLDQIIGSQLASFFPMGILPPAEMEYQGLKNEYNLAWEAKKNGDNTAISKFFDDHPEYSARLALRRDPEERLQQFLKSEIWDAYGALGATNKKQATAYLGADFQTFLDSEPGIEFSVKQLATWAKMLNAMIPEVPETQEIIQSPIPQVDFLSKEVTDITDKYFTDRRKKFPHYYALQQTYYSLPYSERNKFLLQWPELKDYWSWKDGYYQKYPELVPVFNGELFRRIDTSTWPPSLVMIVRQSAYTGKRLPSGAAAVLRQLWEMEGEPWGDFESWVEDNVYPSLLNEDMQALTWGVTQ